MADMQGVMPLCVSLFFWRERMARMLKDKLGRPMTWKGHNFVTVLEDEDKPKSKPKKKIAKKPPRKTIRKGKYPPPKKKTVKKKRDY